MFCGGFFIRALCIGVLMERFSILKQKADGVLFLDGVQQQYVIGFLYWLKKPPMILPKPPPSSHKWYSQRKKLYDIVRGNKFQNWVSVMIVLNVLQMSMYSFVPPPGVPLGEDGGYELIRPDKWTLGYTSTKAANEMLNGLGMCFALFYIVEGVMKLIAYGDQYFFDMVPTFGSQTFSIKLEFIILIFCVAELAIIIFIWMFVDSNDFQYDIKGIKDFFALCAALRPIRLLKVLEQSSKNFERLLDVVKASTPFIICTFLLLLLFIFIFGNFGIIFYGGIPASYSGEGKLPSARANFRTLSISYATMFGMLTGELWAQMMHDIMDLAEQAGYEDSSYAMAWMFFTTWLVFAKYVILNQFASIVCDTWSETKQAEKHPVGKAVYEDFSIKWSVWQLAHQGHTDQHNLLPLDQVPEFVQTLVGPFKIQDCNKLSKIIENQLAISEDGTVHIVELFDTLMKNAYERGRVNLIPTPTMKIIVTGIWGCFPDLATNKLPVDTSRVYALYKQQVDAGEQIRMVNLLMSTQNELERPAEDPLDR